MRAGSISGNSAARMVSRRSARVPASSTPVAPPPITVTVTSLRSPVRLIWSSSAVIRSRRAMASRRVYRPRACSAAPGMPWWAAVTPVATMR